MLKKLPLLALLVAAAIIGTTPAALAQENMATVHGTIYDLWTFEPLENVVIKAYSGSTLRQQIFSTDGTYSLFLYSGSYTITAKYYYKGTTLMYEDEENIALQANDNLTLDLIMFPTFEENELSDNYSIPLDEGGVEAGNVWLALGVVLVIVAAGALAFYYLKILSRRKPASAEKVEMPSARIVGLPDDLGEVMDVIMVSGGRINQVDLRQKLPHSEAKVSLMIADLEDRGLVRKIKKGRGNIIVLTELKNIEAGKYLKKDKPA
jgi:uncharacterized membrane protein